MKKHTLFLMWILASVLTVNAQEKVTLKVTSNENIDAMLASSRFLFPAFEEANVYMKGNNARAKMNYNMLTGEMLFVDEKGDTLALKDKNEVVAIIFGKRLFKYSPRGYVEVLSTDTDNNTELSLKRAIKQGERKKYGAYGTTSNISSIENYAVETGSGMYKLSAMEQVSYKWDNSFYLNTNGKYRLANKQGFLKTYAKQKNEIEDYLKQYPVDFTKEEDVLRLFQFCTKK